MRKRAKITEATAATIQVPDGKRDVIIFDEILTGFFVRVYANGRANYGIDYYVDGKRRRMTLGPAGKGTLATARKNAGDVLAKARLGDDTLGERQENKKRGENSFKTISEKYLKDAEPRLAASTHRDFSRYLMQHLKPLHLMPVAEIERRDIVSQIDRIVKENGASAADHCRATLSAFFAWCIERQYRDDNPSSGIAKRSTSSSRSRVLSDSELSEIWRHAGDGGYGAIVKLLMLTGQRRAEIGGLRWSEFGEYTRRINLPTDRVKNRREHIVPLSDQAMAVLASVPRWEGHEYMFGKTGKTGFSGWSKSKMRHERRINTAREKQGLENMPDWGLHDLRRTVASGMARLGVALPVIERVLNHQSGSFAGIVGVYQRHTFEDEMRVALERWGKHVINVCETSEDRQLVEQAIDPSPLSESQLDAMTV